MGYDLHGYLVNTKTKQVLVQGNMNILKNLNNRSYSADFDAIESTSKSKIEDYPEISEQYTNCYIGRYPKENYDAIALLLNKENLIRRPIQGGDESKYCAYLYKGSEELFNEKENELRNLEATSPEVYGDAERCFSLYQRRKEAICGNWYTLNDFINALPHFTEEFDKANTRLTELRLLRNSKDWFEMSEKAQNGLIEELSYVEDDYDTARYRLNSIEYITWLMQFFKDDICTVTTGEDGERKYHFGYNDDYDIELFVEVC